MPRLSRLSHKLLIGAGGSNRAFKLLRTIDNPNAYGTSAGDEFIIADVDGDYLIVGAPRETDASASVSTDPSGKAYIFNITTGTLLHTLNNPNPVSTSSYDYFGLSVAISGNYAVVGAPGEKNSTTNQTGSGYMYVYNVTTGALLHSIANPNPFRDPAFDLFANTVSASAGRIYVSAYSEDENTNFDTSAGKAYRFISTNRTFCNITAIPNQFSTYNHTQNPNTTPNIAGNNDDGEFTINLFPLLDGSSFLNFLGGAQYIFQGTNGYLKFDPGYNFGYLYPYSGLSATNPPGSKIFVSAGDRSIQRIYTRGVGTGSSAYAVVVIEGSNYFSGTLGYPTMKYLWRFVRSNMSLELHIHENLAGPLYESNQISYVANGDIQLTVSSQAGKSYVYDMANGTKTRQIDNPDEFEYNTDPVQGDSFASSLAVDGNYAITGAPYENHPRINNVTYEQSGVAYIHNVSTGALLHTLENPDPSTKDRFGLSVDISGNYAIVGCMNVPLQSTTTDSGKAYIFNVSTGALVHTLDNPNDDGGSTNDKFGSSVKISGKFAAVGAFGEDSESGIIYVFNVGNGNLARTIQNPNPVNTAAGDQFTAAALNDTYLIAAAKEDDAGGNDSGKIYIYR